MQKYLHFWLIPNFVWINVLNNSEIKNYIWEYAVFLAIKKASNLI